MRKFTTTYYKLSSNGKFPEGNGFRLAFISDLHNMEFGPDNTVLKAVIDEAAPDLVIIGGDQIVAKPGENLDPGLSFAERLAEEYQVIYGCGNHEYRLKLYPEQYGDLYEKLRERLKKAGICYLENETADLTISGCPVRIYGYAMARTPASLGLACHRVVNRTGALSPDYAFGGPGRQRERLEAEGITFRSDGRIDMVRHQWQENEQLTFG